MLLILGHFSKVNGQLINNIRFNSGATISNQYWYYDTAIKSYHREFKTGVTFGLAAESLHKKWIRINYGLDYSTKGFNEIYDVSTSTSPNDTKQLLINNRIDYYTFYAGIKLQYPIKSFTPYVTGGVTHEVVSLARPHEIYAEQFNRFSPYNEGFFIGGGLEFKFKSITTFIEYNYSRDITPAFSKDELTIINRAYKCKIGLILWRAKNKALQPVDK
jgi:opacity protein-like surface antigen